MELVRLQHLTWKKVGYFYVRNLMGLSLRLIAALKTTLDRSHSIYLRCPETPLVPLYIG